MIMLTQPPTEFTKQENIIGTVLDLLGIRYAQQVQCGKYILDFVVEETIALEADGIYGHFGKREKIRDEYIKTCYNKVIHIKSQNKKDIIREIEEKLLCQD